MWAPPSGTTDPWCIVWRIVTEAQTLTPLGLARRGVCAVAATQRRQLRPVPESRNPPALSRSLLAQHNGNGVGRKGGFDAQSVNSYASTAMSEVSVYSETTGLKKKKKLPRLPRFSWKKKKETVSSGSLQDLRSSAR